MQPEVLLVQVVSQLCSKPCKDHVFPVILHGFCIIEGNKYAVLEC